MYGYYSVIEMMIFFDLNLLSEIIDNILNLLYNIKIYYI